MGHMFLSRFACFDCDLLAVVPRDFCIVSQPPHSITRMRLNTATYALIWMWCLTSLSWCSDENAYQEDKAFEVLRRVIHHQHESGTLNEDFKQLNAVSKAVKNEIPLNSPLGWKYHRQAIRDSCPAAFREKVFRELFHRRIAYSSWDNPSTDSMIITGDLARYFAGMQLSKFDQCIQNVTKYCQIEGAANNPLGRLSLAIKTFDTISLLRRKSVKDLAAACPIQLQGAYIDLHQISQENKNEMLSSLRSIEITASLFLHVGAVRLPKVTDLSLILRSGTMFDLKQMLDYTFDATRIESIKISMAELYFDYTSYIASFAQFIQKCKKLSSLNVVAAARVNVDAIINSAPASLNHFMISGISMKTRTVEALNGLFERATQLQTLHLDYAESTVGLFPTMTKNIKSLALLPSNDRMHASLPSQLKEMTALEKLKTSISIHYKHFYLNLTESVKELYLVQVSFPDDEDYLKFLGRFQTVTFERPWYKHVDKALKVVLNSDNIRSLNLRSCAVLKDVFPIKETSRIENLTIDNYIGSELRITRFASSLIRAFKKMPNLKEFSFQSYNNYVAFAPVHDLMKRLAQVRSLVYVDIFVSGWKYSKWDRMAKNTFGKSLRELWDKRKDLIIVGH